MKKTTKARKYNSALLQELLNEVTPLEMEQTKVKMLLAARIEDLMTAKGWSKSAFAEKVGKHPSEITKWLSGTQNFTTEVLTEIAFVFGVELSALFGKEQHRVIQRTEITVKIEAPKAAVTMTTPMLDKSYASAYNFNVSQVNKPNITTLYQA